MDRREVLDNGIKLTGSSKRIEDFMSLGAAAKEKSTGGGDENKQEGLTFLVEQEISNIFNSIQERALKEAFKKGTDKEKLKKLKQCKDKVLARFLKTIEESETSMNEEDIRSKLSEFLKDPENLKNAGNKTVEKLITASVSLGPEKAPAPDPEKVEPIAPTDLETEETSTGEKIDYESYWGMRRYNNQGAWMEVIKIYPDKNPDETEIEIIFGTGEDLQKKSRKYKPKEFEGILKKYDLSSKPEKAPAQENKDKKTTDQKSGTENEEREQAKESFKLKKLKDRIREIKDKTLSRLEELFKKDELSVKNKKDALRFKDEILIPEKWRLDVGKIDISGLSDDKKNNFWEYVNAADAEIEQKVRERIADLDEFLSRVVEGKRRREKRKDGKKTKTEEQANPGVEIPATPSEPEQASLQGFPPETKVPDLALESYLGEEIPAERKKEEIVDSEALEKAPGVLEVEKIKPKEVTDEVKDSNRERVDKLIEEIDKARKEYLEIDYKKRKAYKRLWDFFGTDLNKRELKLERDEELAYYRGHYDNKLWELKNFLLEDAEERKVSNEELGELVKRFAVEANIKIADTHTAVKIEHHEGRWSGWIKNNSAKIVESYGKMHWSKKAAIAGAFGIATVGAGSVGAAAVGVVASVATIRRAFLGMVSGTGLAMGLEKRSRAKIEKEIEKVADWTSEKLENKNNEERLRLTRKMIDKLIYDEDHKINKIKNRNLRQLAAGIGFGTFIGSGAASEILREGWHKIAEYIEYNDTPSGSGAGSLKENVEKIVKPEGSSSSLGADAVEAVAEKPHFIDLPEIKEGGNIQASIRDYYRAHPDLIDKYNNSPMSEGRKFNANQIAERIWSEYGDKQDLVHEGAQVHLSPDGMHIENVTGDENMGYLPEKEVSSPGVAETEIAPKTEIAPEPEADVPPSGTESPEYIIQSDAERIEVPTGETGEYLMDPETAGTINLAEEKLKLMTGELSDLDDKILKISSGQYESVPDLTNNPDAMLDELRAKKQLLENTREYLEARIYAGHVGSLRKFFSGGNKLAWDRIREMRAWDMLDDRKGVAHKFYDRVLEMSSKNLIELKEHISPTREETMDAWILRLSKIMRKLGISQIK